MVILEVTAVPFNEYHRGGGESYPWKLSKELSKFEDVIFCTSAMRFEKIENFFNIDAYFINASPFINIHNPIPSISGFLEIKQFVSRNDVEFIHIHNLRTIPSTIWLMLAKMQSNNRKFKVILTDHSSKFFPFPKLTAKMVDYYAPVSKYSAKILYGYAIKPTFIVPPIVQDEFFKKNIKFEKNVDILYLARFIPQKRQDLIIKIAHKMIKNGKRDLKVVIAGGAQNKNYIKDLKQLVSKLNIEKNIEFKFNVSDDYVLDLISNSKFMSHITWYEDMYGKKYRPPIEYSSAVMLEGAAMGVPSIASDIEPFKEIISEGINGIFIDPTNIEISAQKISKLLEDDIKYKEMAIKSREIVYKNNRAEIVIRNFRENLKLIRDGII